MTNEELLRKVNFDKPDFSARSSEVYNLGEGKVLKLYFSETEDASIDRGNLKYKGGLRNRMYTDGLLWGC